MVLPGKQTISVFAFNKDGAELATFDISVTIPALPTQVETQEILPTETVVTTPTETPSPTPVPPSTSLFSNPVALYGVVGFVVLTVTVIVILVLLARKKCH
jgi:hypothetical protein